MCILCDRLYMVLNHLPFKIHESQTGNNIRVWYSNSIDVFLSTSVNSAVLFFLPYTDQKTKIISNLEILAKLSNPLLIAAEHLKIFLLKNTAYTFWYKHIYCI